LSWLFDLLMFFTGRHLRKATVAAFKALEDPYMRLDVTHTLVFGISETTGNPAPVVFNADDLTTLQMQAIAAHFGQETVFVLKPINSAAHIRLRYFVPHHEMEMCVHATVATITVLVRQRVLDKSPAYVETTLGIIAVHWQPTRDEQILVMVEQFPPKWSSQNPDKEQVAAALRISSEAVVDSMNPVQSVSTSRFKLIIPLKDWNDLDRLQPDFERLWAICDAFNTTGFYPFTVKTLDPSVQVEARQFPKRAGYDEDPATGVAASALSAYLTKYKVLGPSSDGWHSVVVGQGRAMKSPSTINTEVFTKNDDIILTRVGGTANIKGNEILDFPDSKSE